MFRRGEDLDLDKLTNDQDNKNTTTTAAPNELDDLIDEREKLSDDDNNRVDIDKTNEHLDSEEDTGKLENRREYLGHLF